MKLDQQHIHLLKLIRRDKRTNGWTPTSSVVHSLIKKNIPTELVDLKEKHVRLTRRGNDFIDFLSYLKD